MLVTLIADLTMTEARLHLAMLQDSQSPTAATLIRHAASLMERIEAVIPRDRSELNEKIAFFTRRATRLGQTGAGQRDMRIAVGLMRDFPDRHAQSARADAIDVMPDDDHLAAYVSASAERLVAVDRNYRYLAVSPSNAAFHRSTQSGLIGTHMRDLIGQARFDNRARARLDACFAGEPQEYHYSLTQEGQGSRVIRCQMKPVGNTAQTRFCSLLYMTDVTAPAPNRPLITA